MASGYLAGSDATNGRAAKRAGTSSSRILSGPSSRLDSLIFPGSVFGKGVSSNTEDISGVETGPGSVSDLLARCLTLDGADEFIDTVGTSVGGVDLFADSDSWSLAFWCKTASTNGTMAAKAGATPGNRTLQLFISTASVSPGVIIRGTQTNFAANAHDNEWHHWCLTWSGTAAVLYKDGVGLGAIGIGSAAHESTQSIKFGARTNTPAIFLAASYVDIRMYSRALTADDAAALTARAAGVSTAAIVGHIGPSISLGI